MLREFRKRQKLMGTQFEFVLIAEDNLGEGLLKLAIDEVKRIENLLTEFSNDSQTMLINQNAFSQPIHVESEVYAILGRCASLNMITQGAFDITASLFKKLYAFKGERFLFPSPDVIRRTAERVGMDKISLLADNSVRLLVPGMHIGFGGIGKGYAADCVKKILLQKGVQSGVINASGDLTAWGKRLDGNPWKIGIANPDSSDDFLFWIPVHNSSVATSGDYEQFFEHDGKRYSHTIDPKTGYPVSGIKSVTVFGPSGELADALATAITIMGVEVGLHFIEQLPSLHAIIIDDKNKIHFSRGVNSMTYEEKVA